MTDRGPGLGHNINDTVYRRSGVLGFVGTGRLPPDLGKEIRFDGSTGGKLDHVDTLEWKLNVTTNRLDFAGWRAVFPQISLLPTNGIGEMKLTGRFVGKRPMEASGAMDLTQ